jgi:hypothetical protein
VMSESARDVRMICPPPSPNEPSMLSMEAIIYRDAPWRASPAGG